MGRNGTPGEHRGQAGSVNEGGHYNPSPPRVEPPPQPDRTAMHSALDAMFGPDDVIELRAFPKGRRRTIAGYFDAEHRGDLVKQAFQLNMNGALCYITLNSIDPQLLGRYRNRVQEYADATTSDKDVIRRRWLLLDFDPIRPRDTPATKAQLDAAHERCRACAEHLATLGWPAPITALSGNGLHLYYAIDLPNDPETTELIKGALAALAEQFDTDKVLLDQSVFNPSRVTKLMGTVTTKGDHTPAMPWRLSQLLEVPDRGAVVTAEQLKAFHPPIRATVRPPLTVLVASTYRLSSGASRRQHA
jgi:hypothetical protein